MKNVKCIVGATLLAPVALSAFLGALFGFGFLINMIPDIGIHIIGALIGLFALSFIWLGIYSNCVDHYEQKSNKALEPTRSKGRLS